MNERYLTEEGYKIVIPEYALKEALAGKIFTEIIFPIGETSLERWGKHKLLDGITSEQAETLARYFDAIAQVILGSGDDFVAYKPNVKFENLVFGFVRDFYTQGLLVESDLPHFCNKLNHEVVILDGKFAHLDEIDMNHFLKETMSEIYN